MASDMGKPPKILFLTPPLLAPNAPYPATQFLTAYLRANGVDAVQDDFSVRLLRMIFTGGKLRELSEVARMKFPRGRVASRDVKHFLANRDAYCDAVDCVVEFASGKSKRMVRDVPQGASFAELAQLREANPALYRRCASDKLLLAGLFLDDIARFIRDAIDPFFEFSRYGEKLAASAPRFDAIRDAVEAEPSVIDAMLASLCEEAARRHSPDAVVVTVPFPGNLYGACMIGKTFKRLLPGAKIVLGGGYVSTELREMDDPGIFAYADGLSFDDGEAPLLEFARVLGNRGRLEDVPRMATARRLPRAALSASDATLQVAHDKRPAPCYDGLPLDRYFAVVESPNPMLRMWSGRFWNKVMVAHGCYWHRCAFCDTSLDYICRCDMAKVRTVERWMDEVFEQTGQRGFHFVDEAAPPAILRGLSGRLAERGRPYEWWTNIRLDRAFTPEVAREMAAGGCIAVTAGLEYASDRMLRLIDKGVTRADARRICEAFADAGVMVHLYMMHGYPSQTLEEVIDDLDFIRGLFADGLVQSAYWHQFALTCHSKAYGQMKSLGMRPQRRAGSGRLFARNEVPFIERAPLDHREIGRRLNAALFNYQSGVALEIPARDWF